MAKKRSHQHGNPLVVLLVTACLLAGLFYLNEIYKPAPPDAKTSTKGDFTLLSECELIEDSNRNDGDSFRVRHGKDDYVFRLYFVDCPEKRVHDYDKDRIADQGRYFGGLSESKTLKIGMEAKDFTLDLLRRGNFEVLTKWEEVYSSGRLYALIRFPETDKYLHKILVAKGFARIHTRGTDLTNESRKAHEAALKKIEATARAQKVGGWDN